MRKRNIFLASILAILFCVMVISGCANDNGNPNQGQIPSESMPDPTGTGTPINPNSPTDPTPTQPVDDNSPFMDGEDHVSIPF